MKSLALAGMLCWFSAAAYSRSLVVDVERDSLSLNGRWLCLEDHGDAEIWNPETADSFESWQPAEIPGALLPDLSKDQHKKIETIWAARTFSVAKKHAAKDAVLKWNGIRFGASVWINGRFIARHVPIGPHTVLLPRETLHAGENRIVVKVPGWAGLDRGEKGYPLFPTGSSTCGWGSKTASIYDDIWLEFYDRAYMKNVFAVPDLEKNRVVFRISVEGIETPPSKLKFSAKVSPCFLRREETHGSSKIKAELKGEFVEIPVAIDNPQLWSPKSNGLYLAEIQARDGWKLCDKVSFRFGMREIKVVDGHYRLNGDPIWFRGSNLVNEWTWLLAGAGESEVKRYLIDEARNMNLNCFRTHTIPPPTSWCDIADENGMMIWAEFPMLYNFQNFKFTNEEREIFHRNAMLDARAWVEKLRNHPSIVMWVLSNESGTPEEFVWEAGPFRDHVVALDPTRPTMRTAAAGKEKAGTKENLDIHTCANYYQGPEGRFLPQFKSRAAGKDPLRTLTNSEYMNGGPWKSAHLWVGRKDHPYAALSYAEVAMEHTEAMRRLNFDGVLPYMYAGWPRFRNNDWRPDFPTPMAAALHSSMAPVLASLDTFDRNYTARKEISTPLVLINEELEDIEAEVAVYLTPADPLFVPDSGALEAAISEQRFEQVFKAASITETTIRWTVPQEEGQYYLAAVVYRKGSRPVVSQRVIRSIRPAVFDCPEEIVVLGACQEAEDWLRLKKIPYTTSLRKTASNICLVWDHEATNNDLVDFVALREFVENEGRLVVLRPKEWTWKGLADIAIRKGAANKGEIMSRAFPYPGADHPMMRGIDPEFLKRWNGVPGTVVDSYIEGPGLAGAEKILWAVKQSNPLAVSIPLGKGEIIISQLHIKGRLFPDAENYDPVAERILVNLIMALEN